MKYEIKNISLTSVLKMSFLTLLTTGTIFFTFMTLSILRLVNSIGAEFEEMSDFGIDAIAEMSLSNILLSSFIFGVLISIAIVFWISLIVIFYNFFAKLVGGIVMEFVEK